MESGVDGLSAVFFAFCGAVFFAFGGDFAAAAAGVFRGRPTLDAVFFAALGGAFADADGGSFRFLGRPALDTGMGVSGGSMPSSIDIPIAFGMESQLLPFGAIHFRRRRFCGGNEFGEKKHVVVEARGARNQKRLTSNFTVHPSGNPLALASCRAL